MPAALNRRRSVAIPIAVAALLTITTTAAQQDPREDSTGPVRSDEETLRQLDEKRVRLRFERATLVEWTKSISASLAIPVMFPPRVQRIDAARTTLADLSLPELPARQALDAVAVITGLKWRVFRGIVFFDVHVPSAQIYGEVLREGPAVLNEGDTVLALLARTEWTEAADLEHVVLVRPGASRTFMQTLDLRRAVLHGVRVGTPVQDGDLLVVPAVHEPHDEPTVEDQPVAAAPAAQQSDKWVMPGQKVVFFVAPATLRKPEFEQLTWLTRPQTVDHQGRILIPYVGRVVVRGLTQEQVQDQVKQKLFAALSTTFPIRVRVFPR